ncbi:MAG TPA: aldose epimerase family protein [Anaerovoracaceae bacterium]|nr:aldose epimerase family protein [Anaerovoracaceae bacterium]
MDFNLKKGRNGVMVSCEKWGMYEGKDIFLCTLENEKGMKVGLTNFGCAVTSILVKGIDVALGFDHPDGYVNQNCYLGVTAGRCANRIKDGRFELNGAEYAVSRNLGNHHLHGGFKGFDKVLWDVDAVDQENNAVRFSYLSKDGEEGYPGNLTVKVTYSLDEEGGLKIEFKAETDRPTLVNLANHTYFNLSGHDSGNIEDHWVKIHSDAFLEADPECVPTGMVLPVAGTPFEFREFHMIGERIGTDDIQLKNGGGYDHNYIIDRKGDGGLVLAAEAASGKTGIQLQVFTTAPGIQFYSGNSLSEKNAGKDGAIYGWRCGFCLETQFYPDAIHHPEFPQPVLLPGQKYSHTAVYRFTEQSS